MGNQKFQIFKGKSNLFTELFEKKYSIKNGKIQTIFKKEKAH